MPDPDANPNAKVMAIDAIQEACEAANCRLRFLPEGPDADDKAAEFVLANFRVVSIPLKQLKTDKNRETAVAALTERLQSAYTAK